MGRADRLKRRKARKTGRLAKREERKRVRISKTGDRGREKRVEKKIARVDARQKVKHERQEQRLVTKQLRQENWRSFVKGTKAAVSDTASVAKQVVDETEDFADDLLTPKPVKDVENFMNKLTDNIPILLAIGVGGYLLMSGGGGKKTKTKN